MTNFIRSSDPKFPMLLKRITDCPKGLYHKGDLSKFDFQKSVCIVGTRKITDYGRQCIDWLIQNCARYGISVVSGLAIGVDSVTHYRCLEMGVKTLAVLPLGIDNITPSRNRNLYNMIISSGGCVISEDQDVASYNKYFFPRRNRIIAGLSPVCIVVEAGRKSGSIITADLAFDYGRIVFAIPGDLNREYSVGANNLIVHNKAELLSDFNQVCDALGIEKSDSQKPCNVSDDALMILKKIGSGINYESKLYESIESISKAKINLLLTELELNNIIMRSSTGEICLQIT